MATVTREREELIEELKRASMAVFAGFEYEVAKDLSRLYREAAAALAAPPASDPPGPTVINEDDGDVTIDFDYAHDRVVSIRLGEESSGLSAFVDGESHALCPLDRVPPKVLALLRTSAKLVTLRQSDPPGLVALVDKHIDGLRRAYSLDGIDAAMREMGKIRIEALECFRDTLPPASPQAETKGDE